MFTYDWLRTNDLLYVVRTDLDTGLVSYYHADGDSIRCVMSNVTPEGLYALMQLTSRSGFARYHASDRIHNDIPTSALPNLEFLWRGEFARGRIQRHG